MCFICEALMKFFEGKYYKILGPYQRQNVCIKESWSWDSRI